MRKSILKSGIFTLVVVLILPTLSVNICGADVDWWPMYQHDPQHTGISSSKAPSTNNVLWSFKGSIMKPLCTPVVVDNRVFVTSNYAYSKNQGGVFFCLDAETGGILWSKTFSKIRSIGSPSVDGDRVYVYPGSLDYGTGSVYCYNVTNGNLLWKKEGFGNIASSAIADGMLYFNTNTYLTPNGKGAMYCMNDMTGAIIWNRGLHIAWNSVPTVVDGRAYVTVDRDPQQSDICCLNASTGETIWTWVGSLKFDSVQISSAVSHGRLYIGSSGFDTLLPNGSSFHTDGLMFCVDAVNGTTLWQSSTRASYYFPAPMIYENKVYICDANYTVYCFNADSGNVIWKYQTYVYQPGKYFIMGKYGIGSLAAADGKVYANTRIDKFHACIYCFNASTGKVLWKHAKFGWYTVVGEFAIADEKMYSPLGGRWNNNGVLLYCFSDVDSHAPAAPKISGIHFVSKGKVYNYSIRATDPDGDDIYYHICWGDGAVDQWIGPYQSGQTVSIAHTWMKSGWFEIKARAKDVNDLRGSVGALKNIIVR